MPRLRTPEQKAARAEAMKRGELNTRRIPPQQAFEITPGEPVCTLNEAAAMLHCSYDAVQRYLKNDPGYLKFFAPGAKRPMIRVTVAAVERLMRTASG